LTGLGVAEEIASVLQVREPIYRSLADLIVPTGSASPETLASQIARWWLRTVEPPNPCEDSGLTPRNNSRE
jgi:shikimate kinase